MTLKGTCILKLNLTKVKMHTNITDLLIAL